MAQISQLWLTAKADRLCHVDSVEAGGLSSSPSNVPWVHILLPMVSLLVPCQAWGSGGIVSIAERCKQRQISFHFIQLSLGFNSRPMWYITQGSKDGRSLQEHLGHFTQQVTETLSIEKKQRAITWVVQGKLNILADSQQPAIVHRARCSSFQLLQQMHHPRRIVSVPVYRTTHSPAALFLSCVFKDIRQLLQYIFQHMPRDVGCN